MPDEIAPSVGDAAHGRIGRSIAGATEPGGQPLQKRPDRWHRRTARGWVNVAQLVAVAAIRVTVLRQRGQRLARARVRIAEHRRAFAPRLPVDGHQVVAETGKLVVTPRAI